MDLLDEGVVEGEESSPVIYELDRGDLFLDGIVGGRGVVDHSGFEVVILVCFISLKSCFQSMIRLTHRRCIIHVEHSISNIWNIVSRIRFTSDVNLSALQTKSIDEVLPKSEELCSNIFFAGSGRCSLRKAGADGLLYPYDVCEVGPGPGVLNGGVCSILPDPGTVFLDNTFER